MMGGIHRVLMNPTTPVARIGTSMMSLFVYIHMWRCYFMVFCLSLLAVEARFDRIGYVSDPVSLLMQDSYSSMKQPVDTYSQPMRRQIRKRKYSLFPPTFYSSFGFGPMPFNRRQIGLPYNDLLFSGR